MSSCLYSVRCIHVFGERGWYEVSFGCFRPLRFQQPLPIVFLGQPWLPRRVVTLYERGVLHTPHFLNAVARILGNEVLPVLYTPCRTVMVVKKGYSELRLQLCVRSREQSFDGEIRRVVFGHIEKYRVYLRASVLVTQMLVRCALWTLVISRELHSWVRWFDYLLNETSSEKILAMPPSLGYKNFHPEGGSDKFLRNFVKTLPVRLFLAARASNLAWKSVADIWLSEWNDSQVMERHQGDFIPASAYLCVLIPRGPSEGRTLAERHKECVKTNTSLVWGIAGNRDPPSL